MFFLFWSISVLHIINDNLNTFSAGFYRHLQGKTKLMFQFSFWDVEPRLRTALPLYFSYVFFFPKIDQMYFFFLNLSWMVVQISKARFVILRRADGLKVCISRINTCASQLCIISTALHNSSKSFQVSICCIC